MSVRLSVPAACGGFAAVGEAGRKYRSIAARPAPQQHGAAARRAAANAGSATFSAYVCSLAEPKDLSLLKNVKIFSVYNISV